jgi:AraC-like DNA-binding protein
MLGLHPFSTYLYGPILLLIAIRLIWPERRFKGYDLLHLIPFVIHFITHWENYSNDSNSKLKSITLFYENLAQHSLNTFSSLSDLMQMLMYYSHRFIYIGVVIYLLKKYNQKFENALVQRQRFAHILFYGSIVYSIIWFVLRILNETGLIFSDMNLMMFDLVMLSIVIIVLALFLFRYNLDDVFSTRSTTKYQSNPMTIELSQKIVEQVEALLLNEKWFSDNELKISDVSDKLGLSTQMISQAINSHNNKNFNDFINEYRMEDIKLQLLKPENANTDILHLAFNSGFNSKATFYRIFKNRAGLTPSQYRKQGNCKIHE